MNPAHPLDGFDLGANAVPTLVDWDLDGDLDLIVPGTSMVIKYRVYVIVKINNELSPEDLESNIVYIISYCTLYMLPCRAKPVDKCSVDSSCLYQVGSDDGRVWYFPWHNGSFHSMNGWDGPFVQIDAKPACLKME